MKLIQVNRYDSTEIINVETGLFTRVRNGEVFHEGSEDWVCLGFIIYNNFGHITERLTREEFFNRCQTDKSTLWYKNGKPKFRLYDYDHGTHRVWSDSFKDNEVYAYFGKEGII